MDRKPLQAVAAMNEMKLNQIKGMLNMLGIVTGRLKRYALISGLEAAMMSKLKTLKVKCLQGIVWITYIDIGEAGAHWQETWQSEHCPWKQKVHKIHQIHKLSHQ